MIIINQTSIDKIKNALTHAEKEIKTKYDDPIANQYWAGYIIGLRFALEKLND